ncbi:MAG: hypothetical protein NT015_09800 [Alphaproteobacteria bacterium]|nr:hypothetical protein [Alphaproteobacteria bacterium]
MRALFLLAVCIVVGCATVSATDVEDRGHGYYRIVASVPEDEANGLALRTRQRAQAYCSAAGGSYVEMAYSDVEPTLIDFSGRDSVTICFRCNPAPETPQRNWQLSHEACGIDGWPLIGYR